VYDVANRTKVADEPAVSLSFNNEIVGCRLCGARLSGHLIDLGTLPVPAFALRSGQDAPLFRSCIRFCQACGLAQAPAFASPAPCPSGAVPLPFHLAVTGDAGRRQAGQLMQKWRLSPGSRVICVGSGHQGVGAHLAASGLDVQVIDAFAGVGGNAFNAETAMEFAVCHGRADLVLLDETLTRVGEPFEFAAGLASLLRPGGIISITLPDLFSLLQQAQFDAFGADSCNAFSLKVLERLLCSVGLRVFDAERLPELGGRLRVHACLTAARHTARPGLKAVRAAEMLAQSTAPGPTDGFAEHVETATRQIRDFVNIHRAAGRRVAAFGATRRTAMLLNACHLTHAEIDSVADASRDLIGMAMPGSRIPIVTPASLAENPPNDLLILPWNQVPECLPSLNILRHRGTQFWTVLPRIGRI
jgi:hypothetical protein